MNNYGVLLMLVSIILIVMYYKNKREENDYENDDIDKPDEKQPHTTKHESVYSVKSSSYRTVY
tara:strand:+ start:1588 stop:1776 length:189 start_codon:yes stop_codon:yes gene_type:complete